MGFTRLPERETGSWVSNRGRRVRELGTDEPEDTDGAEGRAGQGRGIGTGGRWKRRKELYFESITKPPAPTWIPQ